MRRRDFVALVCAGAITGWPICARGQERERVRRIGVLQPAAADDPVFQARLAAFHQGLALLGWSIGRNVRIDTRWATTNAAEIRRHATELVALAPDVILAAGDYTDRIVYPNDVDPARLYLPPGRRPGRGWLRLVPLPTGCTST